MAQRFLATLTGILGFLSFPKYALDFCIWFALVPLLIGVSTSSPWQAFCLGCLAAVVGFCGAFPWVVPTIVRFEDVSLVTAFAFALSAAAYHALQLGIFAAFAAWIMGGSSKAKRERGRPEALRTQHAGPFDAAQDGVSVLHRGPGQVQQVPALLSIACAWVVLEWSFPKVFPWSFATVLSGRLALIQIVEVTGVWGLSFVIAALNVALALAFVSWRDRPHLAWEALALAVSLALAVWGFGTARLKTLGERGASEALARREGTPAPEVDLIWRAAPPRAPASSKITKERRPDDVTGLGLTITVVQGNIASGPRDPVAEGQTFSIYRQLTLRPPGASSASAPSDRDRDGLSIQHSDLIIWPETTIRAVLPETQQYRTALFDVAEQLQRPMLVGSLDAADYGRAEFNSLFVVTPDRKIAGVYHKTRLLPFGESAPLLGSWWRTTGRFVKGESAKLLSIPLSPSAPRRHSRQGRSSEEGEPDGTPGPRARLSIPFAPSICYEALLPGFFNGMVRDGAELLVNITDDSWFGNGNAPWQHLQGVILRAVETRRSLVRASNSGISAVIEPSGRITARVELFTRTLMRAVVTPARGQTPYVRWGNWFAWLCAGMTLLGVLIRWRWLSPLTSASRS